MQAPWGRDGDFSPNPRDPTTSFPRSPVGMRSSTLCVAPDGVRGADRTAFPRGTVGTSDDFDAGVGPGGSDMGDRFGREWWSVELPEGWSGEHDETCSTIFDDQGRGALQISAAMKADDEVSDDDLKEFATDDLEAGAELHATSFGPFVGFRADALEDDFWRETWWLRSGRVML